MWGTCHNSPYPIRPAEPVEPVHRLLKTLYHQGGEDMSFTQVLTNMRNILSSGSYSQIPQLSSSRQMDVNEQFQIVKKANGGGTRRALLIGINYVGQNGQLSSCHNDVGNIKDYLTERQGFQEDNIHVLLDDGNHEAPTYENMIAFRRLVESTNEGDSCFFHYSGHGGRMPDDSGDEDDGYDETLIPVDYQNAGQMRDDIVFAELIGRMPVGSTLTCLMDCCHSGSVLDLPYMFQADGEQSQMSTNPKSNLGKLQRMAMAYLIAKVFGHGVVGQTITTLLGGGMSSSGCGGFGGGSSSPMATLSMLQGLLNMVGSKG